MKAIRAHEIGGPEVLRYEDVPDPSPGHGQALIEIKSIGVNYTDVASRNGTNPPPSLPWTPGREAAGVVTAIGEGVSEVAVGDRVAYAMHTGTYSQQQAVPSWLLVRLPGDMEFATAAATMLQATTAHFLVFGITRLNPGDPVLVHAGAGGMGLMLIQMLKRVGTRVFYHGFHRREGRDCQRSRSRHRNKLLASGLRRRGPKGHRRPRVADYLRRSGTDHFRQGAELSPKARLHGTLRTGQRPGPSHRLGDTAQRFPISNQAQPWGLHRHP